MRNCSHWNSKVSTAPHPAAYLSRCFLFLRALPFLSLIYVIDLAPEVLNAITAYGNNDYPLVRAIARAYSLPPTTLRRYLSGSVTRATSHISEQYLSPAEEKFS